MLWSENKESKVFTMNVLDCSCNGETDGVGRGGECTEGLNGNGRWCYVNKDDCDKRDKYNGKYTSTTPCKNQQNPNKPCACNGNRDKTGFGGPCEKGGIYCYVDKDANCADIEPFDGKFKSNNVCKGKRNKTRLGL